MINKYYQNQPLFKKMMIKFEQTWMDTEDLINRPFDTKTLDISY